MTGVLLTLAPQFVYDLRLLCLGKQHLEKKSLREQEKERMYSDRDLARRHALITGAANEKK